MSQNNRAEKAVELRNSGRCNCCQAVAVALADEVDLPEEQLRMITAGFGGGMGNMEGTCGALVGAGIIAGLKTDGAGTIRYTRQLSEHFKTMSGAVICKDLKGIGTGKILCPCEECVRNAVRAYEALFGTGSAG